MNEGYRPDGYSTVSPYLVVDGAARTIAFLESVFGAEELRRFTDDEGGIVHAEVRMGDTVVMLADGNENWPPTEAFVHVYVPDVNALWERALDAGATSVQEPDRHGDEDRRGGVRDPGGTTWWVATRESA